MLETNQSLKGEKGLELTNVEWLLDHHKTKLQERGETVDDLNLWRHYGVGKVEFGKPAFN